MLGHLPAHALGPAAFGCKYSNRRSCAMQAVRLGSEAIAGICTAVEGWAADVGAQKRTERINLHLELDERIEVPSNLRVLELASSRVHMQRLFTLNDSTL